MDEQGTKDPPNELLTQQEPAPPTTVLEQQDLDNGTKSEKCRKDGSRDDEPRDLVNGTEGTNLPPVGRGMLFSDPDDDVWFEANEQLSAEVSTHSSPPLTPEESPLHEEIQKDIQICADLAVTAEGSGSDIDWQDGAFMDAPLSTQVSDAPVTTQVSDAPVTTQVTDAPLTTQVADALVTAQVSDAPVMIQVSDAPLTTQVTDAPLTTQVTDAPVTTQVTDAPLTTQITDAPVTTQVTDALGTTQVTDALGTTQVTDAPLTTQVRDAPLTTQVANAPLMTQVNDAPVTTQVSDAPVTTQVTDAPVTTQVSDAPVTTQVTDAPVTTQVSDAPVMTQVTDAPLTTQVTDAPLTTQVTDAPLTTQVTDAPLTTQVTDAPVTTQVTDALLTTQVTDAPNTIEDNIAPVTTVFDSTVSHEMEAYLAKTMVKELRSQQKMAEACKAEANYVEMCTAARMTEKGASEVPSAKYDGMGMGSETSSTTVVCSQIPGMGTSHDKESPLTSEGAHHQTGEEDVELNQAKKICDINADAISTQLCLAKSLVSELRIQQKMAEACRAECSYVEQCTAAILASREEPDVLSVTKEPVTRSTSLEDDSTEETDGMETAVGGMEERVENEASVDFESDANVQKELELDTQVQFLTVQAEPPTEDVVVSPVSLTTARVAVCDEGTNTEAPETCSQSTNTLRPELCVQGVNTEPPPVAKDIGCNTLLNCFDVLQRAREMEELQFLKVEHRIAVTEMNEAKSQKMVAEQLTKIVQSDLADLRQQNLTETTRRLQLENELSDAKVDLAQTATQLKEKEERVQELEDSLTGTSLLVRKLEEQNAVSLMSRGGIDYMLQAKLADGRAQEAEQKLELVQSDLLQTQSEVRRLLERVAESSRDRSEMVSSRVHTQLMQIADERAQAAERKAVELEREVHDLRGRLSIYEAAAGGTGGAPASFAFSSGLTGSTGLTGSSGLTGLTSFSGLSTLSSSYSTSGLDSTYSPFSYTTATSKPLSLSEQYNLHGGVASLSSSTSFAPSSSSSSSFIPITSSSSIGGGGESFFNKASTSLLSSTGGAGDGGRGEMHTVGVSGILKPSQMFNRKYGAGSHDQTDATPSSMLTRSQKPDQEDVQLPSFETTPTQPHPPPNVSLGGGHGNADDSDSSDWSSSDSEGDLKTGVGEGGAVGGAIKPSHHTNLIAEWEWRTIADGTDTSSTHPSTTSPLNKRRAPPPVAPKPHGIRSTGSLERAVHFEPGTSFDMPVHTATIQGVRKPRGPRGRSLPSRYRGLQQQQQLFTYINH